MGKLILFKLSSGDFNSGFDISLQICEDKPDEITHPFTTITGKLPPCKSITYHYQQWQESYRSLHQQVRLGSPKKQVTHIANHCQLSANQLKDTLKNWYHCESESFAKIREKLLTELDTQESIRLLIQTDIKELRFLPWHLFFDSFLNQYLQAELALAPVEYTNLKPSLKQNSSIRILAIFGSDKDINLTPDQQILTNIDNAEIVGLFKPNRQELFNHLYNQEWDLLFFAGHSGKNEQTWQGKLYLNDTDIITIDELNNALRQAINKRLKLAVFNSCDGLGLAQDLQALNLAQIIVMREMIPDKIAHVFIQEFLHNFAQNKPLYLAVREAREKLQPLEKQYPCATWLPIICQNPASLPLSWQNLENLELNLSLTPSSNSKTPDNLTHLILETTIVNTRLTLEYNNITLSNTDILVNYTDLDLSMSDEISQVLLAEGGNFITQELRKRQVKQLGEIITTSGGNLKVESIFHAVVYDYQHPDLSDISLIRAIIRRCLTLADTQGLYSLAIPVFIPLTNVISIEQIAIALAWEITSYLQSDTNLEQVKIIWHNRPNQTKIIVDERLNRFYRQFKQFLDLYQEINTRYALLDDLQKIYQQRQMQSSLEILKRYQEQLTKFKENWLNHSLNQDYTPVSSDYHLSLDQISQEVSQTNLDTVDTTVTSLHQNYHEKAGQIWQELRNIEDESEIISLLQSLDTDIDAFAWLNDQYELAIASATARQKKVTEMLQNQVKELEKGQELLHQQLLKLHQQGLIGKKAQGKERNLSFRAYPKINIKVKADDLPPEFRTEKISYTADKKAIKDAYNQGIDISKIAELDDNLKAKFGFI
jgi:O-acetyl-ADP-ribose deacetylase (regulator of RNase III)